MSHTEQSKELPQFKPIHSLPGRNIPTSPYTTRTRHQSRQSRRIRIRSSPTTSRRSEFVIELTFQSQVSHNCREGNLPKNFTSMTRCPSRMIASSLLFSAILTGG